MHNAYLVIDNQKFTPVTNCKIVLTDQTLQSDNIQELLSKARFVIPLDSFGISTGNLAQNFNTSSGDEYSRSSNQSGQGNIRRQPGWQNSPSTRHLSPELMPS